MKRVNFKMSLASAVLLLGLCALYSAVAWAAFDKTWWVPMEYGPPARGLALWAMHIASIVFGIFGFAWWMEEIDNRY